MGDFTKRIGWSVSHLSRVIFLGVVTSSLALQEGESTFVCGVAGTVSTAVSPPPLSLVANDMLVLPVAPETSKPLGSGFSLVCRA